MLFRCRCLLHTLPLSWLWCACCGHFRSASADPNNSWPARTTLLHAHRHTHTYTHTKFFLLASCVFCQLNFSLYTISTLLPFFYLQYSSLLQNILLITIFLRSPSNLVLERISITPKLRRDAQDTDRYILNTKSDFHSESSAAKRCCSPFFRESSSRNPESMLAVRLDFPSLRIARVTHRCRLLE